MATCNSMYISPNCVYYFDRIYDQWFPAHLVETLSNNNIILSYNNTEYDIEAVTNKDSKCFAKTLERAHQLSPELKKQNQNVNSITFYASSSSSNENISDSFDDMTDAIFYMFIRDFGRRMGMKLDTSSFLKENIILKREDYEVPENCLVSLDELTNANAVYHTTQWKLEKKNSQNGIAFYYEAELSGADLYTDIYVPLANSYKVYLVYGDKTVMEADYDDEMERYIFSAFLMKDNTYLPRISHGEMWKIHIYSKENNYMYRDSKKLLGGIAIHHKTFKLPPVATTVYAKSCYMTKYIRRPLWTYVRQNRGTVVCIGDEKEILVKSKSRRKRLLSGKNRKCEIKQLHTHFFAGVSESSSMFVSIQQN